MADNNNNDDNLDIFLTLLESKLKTPFSSTEIPKTIKTLRNEKPVEYLEKVSKVLRRAEKVTQLRFLVGILGIIVDEKSSSTLSSSVLFEANKKDGNYNDITGEEEDEAAAIESILKTICQNAQEAPAYEEWVRVIAGIVEKALILHWGSSRTDDVDNDNDVKEADQVMDKTCKEILDRVRTVLKNTSRIDEDTEYRLEQADADPTFAPFRYALVSPHLLEQVIPDIQTNHHFTVNESADILNIDAKLELEKAKEEAEHQKTGQLAKSGNNNNNNNSASKNKGTEPAEVLFPGFRSTKPSTASTSTATAASKQQQQQQRSKSSMFMPSKRPVSGVAGAGRGGTSAAVGRGRLMGLKPAPSTGLHQRKAGAAQALLQRGRARMLNRAGSSSVKEPRSKMKMIDVTEVEGLQKKEETASTPAEKSAMSAKLGQKRNRSEAVATIDRQDKRIKATTNNSNDRKPPPASDGTTTTSLSNNDNNSTSPLHHHAGALANAALLAYQQSRSVPTNLPRPSSILQPSQSTGSACSNSGGTKQQDWRSLLKEHSNRLSEDDRNRIRQFFVDHVNPTPEQTLYKMKLHEERTTDPKTGEPVKETYYLELDYSNFTSRQSKKVKRYGNTG